MATYVVHCWTKETGHLAPTSWLITAADDDDAKTQLRADAHTHVGSPGFSPEDAVQMQRTDGEVVDGGTLGALAR